MAVILDGVFGVWSVPFIGGRRGVGGLDVRSKKWVWGSGYKVIDMEAIG